MLSDDIRRAMESTRQLQSMTRHADLLRDLTKSLVPESVTRNIKLFQNLIQHFREHSPFQQLERLRLAWAESTSAWQPHMQSVQKLSESMRASSLFEDALRFQQAFSGLEFRDTILRGVFPSFRGDVVSHALTALQELSKSIEEIEPDDLADVTHEEVSDATQSLEARIGPLQKAEDVGVWFQQLIDAVRSSSESPQEKVLWRVVVPLLLALVIAAFQAKAADAIKAEIDVRVDVHVNVLVKAALETGIPQSVGDMGLILRDVQIRSRPRRSSHCLGKLVHGDVVTIVRKGRRWSLVLHYYPETGTPTEGWILSRYLQPIR